MGKRVRRIPCGELTVFTDCSLKRGATKFILFRFPVDCIESSG